MSEQIYFVYILHCENNSYYTGYTTNLMRRLQEHLIGTSKCKYTRSFKPINVAQCWQIHGNKSMAMKVEKYIKKISKNEKFAIIQDPNLLTLIFACKPILKDFNMT